MSELLFVTAQPDVPYFHWQAEIYGHNFTQKGIKPSQIHIIYGLVNGINTPSNGALKLREKGYNVHFYIDNRDKKHYIPSIKPYLVHKWLEQFPENGKNFFLHDADIIFRELPDYSKFLNDDICYMADTIGYIAWSYIRDCCNRYEGAHPTSKRLQLMQEMVDVVGIDIPTIEKNQNNSGGGQYIIKNTTSQMWYKIYSDSNSLYDQMHDYQRRFPISPGEIQFWTAEMWAVLWNLWYFDKETRIIDELNFSWATDAMQVYNARPILHMAGVTDNLKATKFYKGDYINVNPMDKIRENENFFNYIDPNSTTVKYIDVMKDIVKKSKG